MPIIKIKKHNTNYTCISNFILVDDRISGKSKGLLIYLLSLPDTWRINVKKVVEVFQEGKTAIYRAFQELIKAGYCTRHRLRDEKGRMTGIEYFIYEKPLISKEEEEKIGTNPNLSDEEQEEEERLDQVPPSKVDVGEGRKLSEVDIYFTKEKGFGKFPIDSSSQDREVPEQSETEKRDQLYRRKNNLKGTYCSHSSDPWMNGNNPNVDFVDWLLNDFYKGKDWANKPNCVSEIKNNYERAELLWQEFCDRAEKEESTSGMGLNWISAEKREIKTRELTPEQELEIARKKQQLEQKILGIKKR